MLGSSGGNEAQSVMEQVGDNIIHHVSNSDIHHPIFHLPHLFNIDMSVTKHVLMLWMVAFSFIYYVAIGILWLIVVTQFLFSLFTNNPNENILKLSNGFRNYMVQILDFITYQSDEKPFPFSDFPKSKK